MLINDKIFRSSNTFTVKESSVTHCCLFKNESKIKSKTSIVAIDHSGSNLSVTALNRFFVLNITNNNNSTVSQFSDLDLPYEHHYVGLYTTLKIYITNA